MLNLDPAKLLVIMTLAVIVVGPDKLPRYIRRFVQVWRRITNYRDQAEQEFRKILPTSNNPSVRSRSPDTVSHFVTELLDSANVQASTRHAGQEDLIAPGHEDELTSQITSIERGRDARAELVSHAPMN